jgi:hypothetical protein
VTVVDLWDPSLELNKDRYRRFLVERKNEEKKLRQEVWAPGLGAPSGDLRKGPPHPQGPPKRARENRGWSSWCLKRGKEVNQNKSARGLGKGTFSNPKINQ